VSQLVAGLTEGPVLPAVGLGSLSAIISSPKLQEWQLCKADGRSPHRSVVVKNPLSRGKRP
jgi:hypothetical protein